MWDIITYEGDDDEPHFNSYVVDCQTKVERKKVLEAVGEDSEDFKVLRKILWTSRVADNIEKNLELGKIL